MCIVMGDFNAQIGKRTNPMRTAKGKFGLELRNERGDTLVEWATPKDHEYSAPEAGWRWTWNCPNAVTNRIKEDRILKRTEKSIRDTTRTRRHRHHHRYDPTKLFKSR